MSEFENIFLQSYELAVYGCTLSETDKRSLLEKYEMLASAIVNESQKSIIENNLANFEILFNKTLFLSVICGTKATDLIEYKNLTIMLNKVKQLHSDEKEIHQIEILHDQIDKKLVKFGGSCKNNYSLEDVTRALATFGLAETELTEEEKEALKNVDNIEVDENKIFENENATEDDDSYNAIDMSDFNGDEKINLEESNNNDKDEEEEPKTESEEKAEISKLYSSFISKNVDMLANVLSAIYESGFSAMPHAGILINNGTNSPLIKLKNKISENSLQSMQTVPDEGTSYDYLIMQTLGSKIPELAKTASINDDKNAIPDFEILQSSNMVCAALHLQFQSANIDFCKGITSIRKWITETQLKDKSQFTDAEDWIKKVNHGHRRLSSFKHVRSWYEWSLKRIIVESLLQAGVKSLAEMDTALSVLEAINKNVRNVVAVSDRVIGEQEELKISTNSNIDVADIINSLENNLNIGNSNSIQIKQVAKANFDNHRVLTLQIIYDQKKANSSNMFAHEIIDRLADAGTLPSWDNALLGKKEDGSYLFWQDFTGSAEPSKRNYTIYAGSRSGKGVMTSTLIASAMCDGRHVFYTDGKPENGACLGEIAWSQGKEAYVFDGQPSGKKPYQGYMENYTTFGNGRMREPEEVAQYIDKCPEVLFANNTYFTPENQKRFLGVMRYLKSLQLCATVAYMRSSDKLPMNDWQVWIFDEMTDMSNNEKNIRGIFAKYVRDKTGGKEASDEKIDAYKIDFGKLKKEQLDKNNEKYDAGLAYIRKWVAWTSNIRTLASNLSTISMGKANMNLIFIFQEATWIQEAKKITTIGKVVAALKSTKIVGRNALANACGDYGEGPTQKEAWYTKIQDGGGWWGISNGADIRTSKVTLFKPYNVWTTPLTADGDKDPNGAKPGQEKRYLGPYITELLGRRGMNPADSLQASYDYADEAVRTLGYAQSLKEYIYDCSNFAIDNSDASYDNLRGELSGNTEDEDISSSSPDFLLQDEDDTEEEALDFGGTPTEQKMSEQELLVVAEAIWSQCETDAIGPEQKRELIKLIINLLRSWGW